MNAETKPRFSVNHLGESSFKAGLRPQYEYRDLGIKEATGGRFGAHVIRVSDAHKLTPEHAHDLEFQMIYILKGWAVFSYEGVGEVRLEAGSCVHQPPGIRHAEVAHSDDLEILEITLPAEFETTAS
jgi:quercetin dioxygenase-like cupin family protein